MLNIFRKGSSATGAIAGGVAAGAALLFAAPAIALAWWRKRKPQDHFFDVPGLCLMEELVFLIQKCIRHCENSLAASDSHVTSGIYFGGK